MPYIKINTVLHLKRHTAANFRCSVIMYSIITCDTIRFVVVFFEPRFSKSHDGKFRVQILQVRCKIRQITKNTSNIRIYQRQFRITNPITRTHNIVGVFSIIITRRKAGVIKSAVYVKIRVDFINLMSTVAIQLIWEKRSVAEIRKRCNWFYIPEFRNCFQEVTIINTLITRKDRSRTYNAYPW